MGVFYGRDGLFLNEPQKKSAQFDETKSLSSAHQWRGIGVGVSALAIAVAMTMPSALAQTASTGAQPTSTDAAAPVSQSPGASPAAQATSAGASQAQGSAAQPPNGTAPQTAQAASPTTPATSQTQTNTGGGIEDIEVTARHRTEKAQDVPTALTVVTGTQLEDTGTFTLPQLQHQVPNMVNYDSNPRNSSIAIRGIGVTSAQDGLDTSVGVYVDNVYLGRPGMALDDLIDISRIEVLRGPQGTLFGRNASAGALNITTNEPSFTPGATAEFSLGNYFYNQERGTVTGPVATGKVAASLTGYNTLRDGILPNDKVGGADNSIGRQGLRGQILLTPSDDVTIRLISEYGLERDSANVSVVSAVLPSSLSRAPAALATAGWTPVVNLNATSINSPQNMSTTQGGSSAEVDWNPGPVNFTSITAYRFWDFNPLQDSDSTPLDILQVNVARTKDWQTSQEFRLASPTGTALDWQTGVFLYHQTLVDNYILNQYGNSATAYYTALNGTPTVIAPGSRYLDLVHVTSDSAALFGQATYHLTNQWSLTGGLRDTADQRDGTAHSSVTGTIPTSLTPAINVNKTIASNNVSGSGGINYQINPNVLAYFTYGNGYKAGGLNLDSAVPAVGLEIKPEINNTWELGYKSTLLDRHLILNLDTYLTLLSNYQANIAPLNGAKSYLTNIGNIRARGFEFDTTYLPIENVKLGFNGDYNEATYTSYRNAQCPAEAAPATVCDLTGKRAFEAPRWIANFIGEYDHDFGDNIEGYFIGQYSWTTGFYGAADDSKYEWQKNYGVLNLRVGARVDDDKYDLALWVNNVLDKKYFTQLAVGSFGFASGQLGDPLTFGVTARANF